MIDAKRLIEARIKNESAGPQTRALRAKQLGSRLRQICGELDRWAKDAYSSGFEVSDVDEYVKDLEIIADDIERAP